MKLQPEYDAPYEQVFTFISLKVHLEKRILDSTGLGFNLSSHSPGNNELVSWTRNHNESTKEPSQG